MNDARISDADILACLKDSQQLEIRGYQGRIHVAHIGDRKIIIKSAAGRGLAGWINRRMLRREYGIYRHLAGVGGVPHCYGFFLDRYLVLEHVDAGTLRDIEIAEREGFLVEMLNIIRAVHARGVAHGELKRKDNVLVTPDSRPCLIDFGVAAVRKSGFHPLNRLWHGFCRQHDFNAWLKHKYGRGLANMSAEDAALYRPLLSEQLTRTLKGPWRRLKRRRRRQSRR